MDVQEFHTAITDKIDYLLEDGIYVGQDDANELEDGCYTMLFNTAAYLVAKKNKISIIPEHPVGRGGYSDITFCSEDGKRKFIEVEHENRPLSKNKGKTAIEKSLINLMNSNAKFKILMTYTFPDYSAKKLLDSCRKIISRFPERNTGIHLLYAPADFTSAKREFKLVQLLV